MVAAAISPLDPIEARMPVLGTVIVDSSGTVLVRDTTHGFTMPLSAHDLPAVAVHATIAAEDRRFYRHPGVDPLAILRAAVSWRSAPSGASTISQQLARRLYLDVEAPRWRRKAQEAWIAVQLEARYSKQALLTAYLNNVYYGRGAYGIDAAARTYFGVPARDLDLAQAAMLAGIPQAPGANDPIEHPEAARARQRYVLDRMVATSRVSPQRADEAAREELTFQSVLPPPRAPHFAEYVRDELRAVRPDLAQQPGLRIETTLSGGLQQDAEHIVRAHLETLSARHAQDAGVVVLDPRTGGVLAMVGSPDYWRPDWGALNLTLQPRQPGSALKPFVYTAALERGYTAASPILDVPTSFVTGAGLYQPYNNDLLFRGPVSMRTALASSLNIPAVRMLSEVGANAFVDVAQRLNLQSLPVREDTAGLGLALGTAEVSLLDLTAAYQVFSQEGRWSRPHAIQRVRDGRGRVLYERVPEPPRQALAREHAFIISDILSDPDARQAGFGGEVPEFETSMYSGVKTGSTSGSRDVWAVGFSTARVVGVWVGNADGTPMIGVSSVSGAAPIWRAVMETAMAGEVAQRPAPPSGVEMRTICGDTGLLPGAACPRPTSEFFVKGTAPAAAEQVYAISSIPGQLLQDVPRDAEAWAATLGITAPGGATRPRAITIVEPPPLSVLFVAPELPSAAMVLRAVVPPEATGVAFRLNNRLVATTGAGSPEVVTRLDPGDYEFEVSATTPTGVVSARSTFKVVRP